MDPIEVEPLFSGDGYATQVYTARAARKAIGKECDSPQRMLKKLAEMAKKGFHAFPVGEDCLLQHEGGGAFRIRYSTSSLFRIVGFYNGPDNVEFIVIDGFTKPGWHMSPSQKETIKWVAKVGQNPALWKKKATK